MYANEGDVRDFIRTHWEEIKHLLNIQRNGTKKRIRHTEDKEIKEEALRLSKLSRHELGCKKGHYKHAQIAILLERRFGRTFNSDTVKSMIRRRKKGALM